MRLLWELGEMPRVSLHPPWSERSRNWTDFLPRFPKISRMISAAHALIREPPSIGSREEMWREKKMHQSSGALRVSSWEQFTWNWAMNNRKNRSWQGNDQYLFTISGLYFWNWWREKPSSNARKIPCKISLFPIKTVTKGHQEPIGTLASAISPHRFSANPWG